jgi:hypothetical protein
VARSSGVGQRWELRSSRRSVAMPWWHSIAQIGFGWRWSAAFAPGAVGTVGGFGQAVGWGHIRDKRRRPGRPIGAQHAVTESLPGGSHSSAEKNLKETPKPVSSARKIDRNGIKIREILWR